MNLVRAIVIGLVCAALGWTVSSLLWTPHPVIQIEVYQEMWTESPKEGFEELVGYDGKLPFFWNDLVATRDYRMAVLGRLPKQAGLLPTPSVNRYMEIDRRWTEQMFLSVYYAYAQSAPSAAQKKEMLMEFDAFA